MAYDAKKTKELKDIIELKKTLDQRLAQIRGSYKENLLEDDEIKLAKEHGTVVNAIKKLEEARIKILETISK